MTDGQEHLVHLKYRPDIDGLRAIAVLAVVAFHAFPSSIRGGFIGVDIFFVISGYLISTIIFKSLDDGAFSFVEFYSRRIKRIFPALILVLAACFAFGWFALLADEYKQLGIHITSGAVFVSNFLSWYEVGYFDNAADTKPLLHLWSLGIEEQFYIVWPLLLWLSWRCKLNLLMVTVLVAGISFALNMNGVSQDVRATFYSPQTRFWELLCGSALAWMTLYKANDVFKYGKKTVWFLSNAISFIGLLLLGFGFWYINKELGFPGAWALIPVASAVLLIMAGPNAWVNQKILSNKLVVWFGLISFPLYLWHWPLLSFARIVEGEVPGDSVRIFAVAMSILLAWLTYRLVERPLRFGKFSQFKTASLLFLMIVIGYVGYNSYAREGLLFRFNRLSSERKVAALKIAEAWKFNGYPIPENSFKDLKYGSPRIGHNDDYKILFLGDSHAWQYANSFQKLIDNSNMTDKPSVIYPDLGFPSAISEALMNDPSIKTVAFSFFWAYRYGSAKVNQSLRCCGNGKDGSVGFSNAVIPHLDEKEMDLLDAKLEAIVLKLKAHNKQVYFVLDNPFGEENDPHAMLSRSWNGISFVSHAALTRQAAIERDEPIRSRLIAVAKRSNAAIIDPIQYLCDAKVCPGFSADGDLLYKDYDHLSLYSSKFKTSYLQPIFNHQ